MTASKGRGPSWISPGGGIKKAAQIVRPFLFNSKPEDQALASSSSAEAS